MRNPDKAIFMMAVSDLEVLTIFAAQGNNETRIQLRGIRIKGDVVCATDGKRLTVLKLDTDSGLDVNIPIESVIFACRLAKAKNRIVSEILRPSVLEVAITEDHIGDIKYERIEAAYPNIGRVIPEDFEKMEADAIALNPKYIADYLKAQRILRCQYPGNLPFVQMRTARNETAVMVRFAPEDRWFSIVMPLYLGKDEVPAVPQWVRDSVCNKSSATQVPA